MALPINATMTAGASGVSAEESLAVGNADAMVIMPDEGIIDLMVKKSGGTQIRIARWIGPTKEVKIVVNATAALLYQFVSSNLKQDCTVYLGQG